MVVQFEDSQRFRRNHFFLCLPLSLALINCLGDDYALLCLARSRHISEFTLGDIPIISQVM